VEYITGMDTRIGYPNEHLASGGSEGVTSPMYATAVGLLMKGLEKFDKQNKKVKTQETLELKESEMSPPDEATTIKGHSKEKTNGFFEKIKKFFDEDLER